jgi:uncharacterized protein (DUF362 family)/NAD-dependent dihydropyrimidine dehydrogenase PreA subunit
MSKVVVRDTDFESLRRTIDRIFEEFEVDLKGKSVLIKPNFGAAVGPEKSALTDARVVKAVLDACLEQTSEVVIGDNPGNLDTGAMHTVKMSGILELAGDFYCNISKEGEFVDIGSEIIPRVFLARKVMDVDYVINIPKMKTHVLCGLSCCIKNLYGYIVGAMKARYHLESKSLKRLTQLWLDLYKYRTPDLNIVDAIVAMEGGGPTHGIPRRVGKIIAGTNGFEVDVVLTTMMGWDPRAIKKLEMAWEQGLGEIDVQKIDVTGDFEVLPTFEKPPTFASIDPKFNPYEEIVRIQPKLDEEKCVLCRVCGDESCPAEAISFEDFPVIDPKKCISCYCCIEFCPEGALYVDYDKEVFEIA